MDQQFKRYNQKETHQQLQQSADQQPVQEGNKVEKTVPNPLVGKKDFTNQSMKGLRFLLGFVVFVAVIVILFSSSKTDYRDILYSGLITEVSAGTTLARVDMKLEAQDHTIINKTGNALELDIWDFAEEDGDYVQVIVDGTPATPEFFIRNSVTKVQVPAQGIIQVKGTRDGGGGITYAVLFKETGEMYLNNAPLNGSNIYTVVTSQ